MYRVERQLEFPARMNKAHCYCCRDCYCRVATVTCVLQVHQVTCHGEVTGRCSKVLQTLQHVAVSLKERPRRLGHGEHVTGRRGDDVFQAIFERHLRVCFNRKTDDPSTCCFIIIIIIIRWCFESGSAWCNEVYVFELVLGTFNAVSYVDTIEAILSSIQV